VLTLTYSILDIHPEVANGTAILKEGVLSVNELGTTGW